MENDKTTLNVSPLLGISEPSLLLESVDMRIAFLRHQLSTQDLGWPDLSAAAVIYYQMVLGSLIQQREELMTVFAKAARSGR